MLWDFENQRRLFPEVDGRARFSLFSLSRQSALPADFCFGLHAVADAADQKRHFTLTADELRLLNPNTRTCPSFLSRRDAELVKKIYKRVPVLLNESDEASSDGSWGIATKPGLFNMATDSGLFVGQGEGKDLQPVYEGKMFGLYDHRAADVVLSETATIRQGQSDAIDDDEHDDPKRYARPRHWIPQAEVKRRVVRQWDRNWIPGWKEITSPTNMRTLVPAVLPLVGIGHKIPVFLPSAETRDLSIALTANLASFVCDYICRNKLNGTSLTPFTVKQLAVLPPVTYAANATWDPGAKLRDWLLPRVLELTYTAWDLEPFAQDMGYDGPPFRWIPERRFLLRAELDAAFFHLYSLSHDETAYILDTFPSVRKIDEKAHRRYRTKDVILGIYDAMADATRTGQPYATLLDPPPADPRVAHELGVSEIPTMPSIVPALPPAQEAVLVIMALLHAHGGALPRTDLARAFALRARPALLRQLAPPTLAQIVQDWASKVGQKTPTPGLLAATLGALADRDGVELATDASSRSVVRISPSTLSDDQLDPWFRFEARLVLHVLRSQPARDLETIDAGITGDDRALLGRAS